MMMLESGSGQGTEIQNLSSLQVAANKLYAYTMIALHHPAVFIACMHGLQPQSSSAARLDDWLIWQ